MSAQPPPGLAAPPTPSQSDARFKPARTRRAFEEIITQIQALIDSGGLQPGDKLPNERALAAQFEVGRNTLREALRMLEISGIVTLRRGSRGGAFVAAREPGAASDLIGDLRLTEFSVADLTQAMRLLTAMLLQAIEPPGGIDLAPIRANIEQAESITDDPRRRAELLIEFYRLLAEATGNKILVAFANVLVEILRGWIGRLGSLGGDRVIRSRRAMVAHLEAGDTASAVAELEDHFNELHKHWLLG